MRNIQTRYSVPIILIFGLFFTVVAVAQDNALPDTIHPVATLDTLEYDNILLLHAASDGAIWLLTANQVYRYVDGRWVVYLDDYDGSPVGVDDHDRLWVVSDDMTQISVWDGDIWRVYNNTDGWSPISNDDCWYPCMYWHGQDAGGRLWLSTFSDVRLFDNERWTVFTLDNMNIDLKPEPYQVSRFDIEHLGEVTWITHALWIPGLGPDGETAVRYYTDQGWHTVDMPSNFQNALVMATDPDGYLWFGARGGLWRYDAVEASWMQSQPDMPPPFEAVRYGGVSDLAFSPAGDAWVVIVLCYGASCDTEVVYQVRDSVWSQITYEWTYGMHVVFDQMDIPWLLGTRIFSMNSDGTAEPVGNLFVRAWTVDAFGQIWFVTTDGKQDRLWTIDHE